MKITKSEAPVSAAIAPHSEEMPANVKITNADLMNSEKAIFWRITNITRREWRISHGNRDKSSDMRAISAVSSMGARRSLNRT